jgi:hypothetical protein
MLARRDELPCARCGDAFNRCLQQLTEHPPLSELYYRGIHDFEALEGADLVRFSALMNQLFRVYEEMYY